MRIFASSGPIARLLQRTFKEGEVLAHPLLNRSIETAQKKVEQYHYSVRKRLLQYDDVLNRQREIIYSMRSDALSDGNARDMIFEILGSEMEVRLGNVFSGRDVEPDGEAIVGFLSWVNVNFPLNLKQSDISGMPKAGVHGLVISKIKDAYEIKKSTDDPDALKFVERMMLVRAVDGNWQKHLTEMDALRNSVGLRGYGQRDPINEYRAEAFEYFEAMLQQINSDICSQLFRYAGSAGAFNRMMNKLRGNVTLSGGDLDAAAEKNNSVEKRPLPRITLVNTPAQKISRNDMCPCGSGKKYKKCCGAK
ncbi:MAG: SEC-C domain-containing protein [Puniceicoccales bacterium]|nr:SEC-C domain-containing protein [Puniceicoccales bacterium]